MSGWSTLNRRSDGPTPSLLFFALVVLCGGHTFFGAVLAHAFDELFTYRIFKKRTGA